MGGLKPPFFTGNEVVLGTSCAVGAELQQVGVNDCMQGTVQLSLLPCRGLYLSAMAGVLGHGLVVSLSFAEASLSGRT
jgi:hypothetical protein